MKCRRGKDVATQGSSCVSMEAELAPESTSNLRVYVCTKCKYKWSVAVGGNIDL